jgi:hypothetical protein
MPVLQTQKSPQGEAVGSEKGGQTGNAGLGRIGFGPANQGVM